MEQNVETILGQRVIAKDYVGSPAGAGCAQCVFHNDMGCRRAPCIGSRRADGRNVMFVAAPAADPAPPAGRKDDGGKLDLTLVMDDLPHALEAVAEVLQWAITKKQPVPYARGSWQGVDDFQRRYRAAMYRHQAGAAKAVLLGGSGVSYERARDAETGLLELAHIATDALFQLEMAVRAQRTGEEAA